MDKTIEKLRRFKAIQESNVKKGEIIIDISYYGKITLSVNNTDILDERQQDLYLVKKEINGKTQIEFKTDKGVIATITNEGQIQISQDFKELINENEFLLQLKNIMPLSLEKLEKLEKIQDDKVKKDKSGNKEPVLQTEEQTEEEKDMPKKYIENPKDAKIDLSRKITTTKTFYDLLPEAKEKGAVEVVVRRKGNLTFEFIGINSAGEEVPFKTLEQTEGTNPNKDIVKINADGSSVKKDQVSTMFKIKNGENEGNQNEGFTIKLGEYGISEVSYYRRSSELNEYSTIPVNLENTNQKRTNLDVREYMEKTKNTTTNDNIERAEERINSDEAHETELENIDDDPYNDVEDSYEIQIKKAAARCKISVEEFKKELNKQDGNTLEEKIEKAEDTINEQFRRRGR
ncbi:MAG: hypothetical protein HFJ58_06015 [Clostridia bacterium]|nr:hypothetical protein [Clostridia bacterium]